jgi:hypothetical protein
LVNCWKLVDLLCPNHFYEKVRIKIACRNPSKIPPKRLFEMHMKLYLFNIMVEGFEYNGDDKPKMDDDDDQGGDEDGGNDDDDDDYDDLDDNSKNLDAHKKAYNKSKFRTPL